MRKKGVYEILEGAVEELCRRVGLRYPPDNGIAYSVGDATWTKEQENDFKLWMLEYLRQTSYFKHMKLRRITQEIDWFVFQYGWKYKEEGVNEQIKN